MDRLAEALAATRETRHVEFKDAFDPGTAASLCETLKDVFALADSGGGVLVIGVDSNGVPEGADLKPLLECDPADIANKLTAYTGTHFDALTVKSHTRAGKLVVTIEVRPARVPLIPIRPGTYAKGGGKQATAFSVGVVYVRHGAKSEPGTSQDIDRIIERRLRELRGFWTKNLRRIVSASVDSEVSVTPRNVVRPRVTLDTTTKAQPVRITTKPTEAVVGLLDPRETHPHRLKEFMDCVNPKLKALGITPANSYDVRAWSRSTAETKGGRGRSSTAPGATVTSSRTGSSGK